MTTESDIGKGLECCSKRPMDCCSCPYIHYNDCVGWLLSDALDLYRKQNALIATVTSVLNERNKGNLILFDGKIISCCPECGAKKEMMNNE